MTGVPFFQAPADHLQGVPVGAARVAQKGESTYE